MCIPLTLGQEYDCYNVDFIGHNFTIFLVISCVFLNAFAILLFVVKRKNFNYSLKRSLILVGYFNLIMYSLLGILFYYLLLDANSVFYKTWEYILFRAGV